MVTDVALAREHLPTVGAHKGLDTSVGLQVYLPVFLASKAFVTHRTLVGLLSAVRPHVDGEITTQREDLFTNGAGVFTTVRVYPHVTLKIAQARKHLITLATLK